MDRLLEALEAYLRNPDPAGAAALDAAVAGDKRSAAARAVSLHRAGDRARARCLYLALLPHWTREDGAGLFNNLAVQDCETADFRAAWRWVRHGLLFDPEGGAEMAYILGKSAQYAADHETFHAAIDAARALAPRSLRYWSAAYVEHCFRRMPDNPAPPPLPPELDPLPPPAAPRAAAASSPRRELRRVVLVGRDFGNIASFNRLFHPLIRLRDQGLELACVSVRDDFRQEEAHFRDIGYVSVPERDPAALARALAGLDADIAIDLLSHGQPEAFQAYAWKPVPVVLGWAGNGISAGIGAFDGFLTDIRLCPPGAERHYAESILRLPVSSVTIEPYAAYPDSRALPADSNGHVTFGCFHRLSKITPQALTLWARILGAVAGSRLVLKTAYLENQAVADRIAAAFAERGIARHRLTILGLTDPPDHCRTVAATDIALSPFPEQGLVTDFDSFWMGLPTVGLGVDDRPCARLTASLAAAAGAPFLATDTPEAYLATAIDLAGDLRYLRAARQSYRRNMIAAGLVDHDRTAAAMAQALREIWARHTQG